MPSDLEPTSPPTPAWRLNLERAARLLAEYSSRLVGATRSVEAASARLTSVAELTAWTQQLQAELAQARAEIERLREIERQTPVVSELRELVASGKETVERLSSELAERDRALEHLGAEESGLRAEAESVAADHARLRAEYEALAREVIALRNESLTGFLARRWWKRPRPTRRVPKSSALPER